MKQKQFVHVFIVLVVLTCTVATTQVLAEKAQNKTSTSKNHYQQYQVQTTGVLGLPDATTTINGKQLPPQTPSSSE
jgi:hypothetical protein